MADPAWYARQGYQAERQPALLRHGGSSDKTLKLYEGYYHDLLSDVGKEEVMQDIKGWIHAHLPRTRRITCSTDPTPSRRSTQ